MAFSEFFDGIAIQKDSASAKQQGFSHEDGWAIYHLLTIVAKMYK